MLCTINVIGTLHVLRGVKLPFTPVDFRTKAHMHSLISRFDFKNVINFVFLYFIFETCLFDKKFVSCSFELVCLKH